MGGSNTQPWAKDAWNLVNRQHGVITRSQLLALGMGPRSIEHRIASGRLHPFMRGIYAVGRPEVTEHGRWMGAVLACGSEALLSHHSAAALWGIRKTEQEVVHVVLPAALPKRRPQIRAHRRVGHDLPGPRESRGIPVTHPVATLVDLAASLPTGQVEAAINEADHLNLVDPERLREEVALLPRWRGVGSLRRLLEGPVLALSSTQLERRFLPLALAAGLPTPRTQSRHSGYRVDFFWPELGLVVEADSLRYHRTAFKQSDDKRRDNAQVTAGLATLRFTHMQICHEPRYVRATLVATARQLRSTAKT